MAPEEKEKLVERSWIRGLMAGLGNVVRIVLYLGMDGFLMIKSVRIPERDFLFANSRGELGWEKERWE